MPKQDGNIKIVESFITSNKPMSLNNKNIYYNEYSDEVLIRYYQTLIAVRKDKSVRILEGINKYSASTNVLVRLIERIAKEKGCTVTYVKQFAKGSIIKGDGGAHSYKIKYWETDEDMDRGESEIYDYYSNKEEAIDRAEKYQSKFSWFAVEVSDEKDNVVYENNFGEYAKGSTIKGVKQMTKQELLSKYKGKYLDLIIGEDGKHEVIGVSSTPKKRYLSAEEWYDDLYAKGSTLKNANSESEKFELKVLQALSGYNNGREENGIMEGLGLSNYRFNQYASKQEVAKVEKTLKSLIKNKYIEEGGIGYKITQIGANHLRSFNYGSYGNGGGVAVSSESGLAVGTNADLLMNQNNLQYADGGGLWKMNDVSKAKYLGILEFQDNEGEYHNFEVMETEDRLVFGGFTNSGFIESGYIDKDGFSTDETLQELLADLEVYYNDGKEYTSMIVVNERMAKGGIMSSGFNYEIGGL
jgi:hypothetical protein